MPGPGAPCGDEWVGMYRGEHMKKIPIDVSGCRDEGDVYDLLLALLVSRIRSLFEEAREGHRADVRLKLV